MRRQGIDDHDIDYMLNQNNRNNSVPTRYGLIYGSAYSGQLWHMVV